MITTTLQNKIVDYVYNQISSVKLIINNTPESTTIRSKVKNGRFIDIYVDVLFTDASDILNGIAIYDSSNNLLAKDLPNLTYNVQSATYMYRLDITSDKQIIEE